MKSRRSFLSKSMLLMAGGMMTAPIFSKAKSKTNALPSLSGRKVLFIHGGWPGHDPIKFRDYMVPWLEEQGAKVEVFDNLDSYTYPEFMDTIDLVIQIHTMSQITKEQEKGLLRAIKNGTGMAGWHGGMCDAFRNNVDYQFMTGGQWVAHPGGVIDYSVQVIDNEDEITSGLGKFNMKSEQYYMHIDPNVKVLATTTFSGEHDSWIDGCVMPVAWKKMYGKGRIFYTSLGHNLNHVTEVSEAITMIKRGIQWASASKYEAPEKWVSPIYKR
jgi:uncharacterized protein